MCVSCVAGEILCLFVYIIRDILFIYLVKNHFHFISFRFISISLFVSCRFDLSKRWKLYWTHSNWLASILLCGKSNRQTKQRCYNFNDDDDVDLYNDCGNVICRHRHCVLLARARIYSQFEPWRCV